jgi:hypothetical protein
MKTRLFTVAIVAGFALLLAAACSQKKQEQDTSLVTFATPEEAVAALGAAAEKHDKDELRRLFGPGTEDLLASGDEVADRNSIDAFVKRFHARHTIVSGDSNSAMLQVGEDDWPLPIPLEKKDGRWHFDGSAGAEAVVRRRIGANELRTIDVMHGYVDAQTDYASTGHDGAAAGVYAQRLRSDPGKQNGLYWEAVPGQPQSPAGPFLANATAEGYGAKQGAPYHGYFYRPLMSQGANANGGAKDYVVNGKQTGGFALIAYPADYGASGIMTFIVSQGGVVWQRDLGDDTTAKAESIQQFNPDSAWTPLPPEG